MALWTYFIICQSTKNNTFLKESFINIIINQETYQRLLYSSAPACNTSIIENTLPSIPECTLLAKNLTASAVPSA